MAGPYHRLTRTRRRINTATGLAMLAGLAIVFCSLVFAQEVADRVSVQLIGGVAIFLLGGLAAGVCELLLKIEANSHRIHELFIEVRSAQEKQGELLEIMSDNSQISDGVKSITHREVEREALRKAIREDILKEDWEAAYSLIEDMENRFGYRLEAYSYRKEVDEFRAKVIEDKLQASVRQARILLNDKQWDSAQAETDRLLRLAPNDARVGEVSEELKTKKNAYKEALLHQWRDAVETKDLDRAVALLKEIDPYLTREEAGQLEETARQVFKAKLLDLGVQFRAAVTDKDWDGAIGIGEVIRKEFPNTKMAQEVAESAEALRARAAGAGQHT